MKWSFGSTKPKISFANRKFIERKHLTIMSTVPMGAYSGRKYIAHKDDENLWYFIAGVICFSRRVQIWDVNLKFFSPSMAASVPPGCPSVFTLLCGRAYVQKPTNPCKPGNISMGGSWRWWSRVRQTFSWMVQPRRGSTVSRQSSNLRLPAKLLAWWTLPVEVILVLVWVVWR